MNDVGQQKTIVIAPLDWGFGHATRIIPIVYWLQNDYKIIVAAPKRLHFLFVDYNVKMITILGYNVKYYKSLPLLLLLLQIPKFIFVALRTKIRLRQIVKNYRPALLISDNRPFFRNRHIPSVYITHQLQIYHPIKFIKKTINWAHHCLMRRFTECWIPDSENHSFSGNLSKIVENISCLFIGGLSRFMVQKRTSNSYNTYKNVCILSGPEPMRTIWMKQIIKCWKNQSQSIIIGVSGQKGIYQKVGNVTLSGHLSDNEFIDILINSEIIVTRSGYTSIMDLLWLRKHAYLIPTPHQYEQEYLAKFHNEKWFKQIDLDYEKLLPFVPNSHELSNYVFCNSLLIIEAVRKLIDKIT